jgi:cytochrome c
MKMTKPLNKSVIAYFIIILSFLIIFQSCCDDCECPQPTDAYISQYTVDKTIVDVNTTNVATGIESVFSMDIIDSLTRAHFCQTFVDAARFYEDESGYFFIETLDNAWVVAHINHDLIGTSRIDIVDENGTYFIKNMVETVAYSGYGFVEYYRKNPSSGDIDRKLSFVTSIPSAQWFIGTGFYGDPPDYYYSYYDANRIVLSHVTNTMAKGIGAIIEEMYPAEEEKIEFCRSFIDHIRFFDNSSGYFFINDLDGICIAHATHPEFEGEDQIDLQDTHGAYIIRDMIERVKNNGSGYYSYFWKNPTTGEDELKTTYVIDIPGTNYFIGAGFYLD